MTKAEVALEKQPATAKQKTALVSKCNKCSYVGDGRMVVNLDNKTLAEVCIMCFSNLLNGTCGHISNVEVPVTEAPKAANREARRKK